MNTLTSTLTSPCSAALFLLILVTATSLHIEAVPTIDFASGGEKEIVPMISTPFQLPSHLASPGMVHLTGKRSIKLCNYRLLDALRQICGGDYMRYNRRSDPDMEDDRPRLMTRSAEEVQIVPSSSSETEAEGVRHLRYRRGIVEECCLKACTLTEMMRYCPTM